MFSFFTRKLKEALDYTNVEGFDPAEFESICMRDPLVQSCRQNFETLPIINEEEAQPVRLIMPPPTLRSEPVSEDYGKFIYARKPEGAFAATTGKSLRKVASGTDLGRSAPWGSGHRSRRPSSSGANCNDIRSEQVMLNRDSNDGDAPYKKMLKKLKYDENKKARKMPLSKIPVRAVRWTSFLEEEILLSDRRRLCDDFSSKIPRPKNAFGARAQCGTCSSFCVTVSTDCKLSDIPTRPIRPVVAVKKRPVTVAAAPTAFLERQRPLFLLPSLPPLWSSSPPTSSFLSSQSHEEGSRICEEKRDADAEKNKFGQELAAPKTPETSNKRRSCAYFVSFDEAQDERHYEKAAKRANEASCSLGEKVKAPDARRVIVKLLKPTRRGDRVPESRFFEIIRLGEDGSGVRTKGEPQDFYELRDQHLRSNSLFEDPDFPAENSSLFFSQRPSRHVEWLRPAEICQNPQLFVEGYSRFDVQQGELGDCWLLAAVANLTLYRRLFFQIVPDDQGFDEKYAGIFHFRFWQYGKWIDVVIDDRLPTYRGQLIYLRSTEENEFWSALLEKAYAKLNGSYEALKGGSACEAMEDFTGGVTEMYELNATPPNLFKILIKAYERGSLMSGSLEPDPHVLEAQTSEGLIRGHAYSITRVKYVDIHTPNVSGKIPLLRLRNPWGNEDEWNGPWSDGSPEWQYIPQEEKDELGLTFDHDGEFWMSFRDFQTHFSRLEICNLTPDSLTDEELEKGNKKQWEMSAFEGEWVRGTTAGGCRNNLDTFWHNPQYRISLDEPDEDDEEGKCTLIVALMQKHRRSSQLTAGVEFLTIGFAIYYLPDPDRVPKPLDLNFFKYHTSVARSPSFINLREVSCRFHLPPGTYCIVPSTFDPNEEGEFLLRVFSETKNHMEEHDESVALGEMDDAIVHRTMTEQEKKDTDDTHKLFLKLAGDDMEVDWTELKDVLDYALRNATRSRGFSKDACHTMIALVDDDRSGKLAYSEFKRLWADLLDLKAAFAMHDRDGSGALSDFELRDALRAAGCHLNNRLLNVLLRRYGVSSKSGDIYFEDFIVCALKLKVMIEIFNDKDSKKSGRAEFRFREWIEATMYS